MTGAGWSVRVIKWMNSGLKDKVDNCEGRQPMLTFNFPYTCPQTMPMYLPTDMFPHTHHKHVEFKKNEGHETSMKLQFLYTTAMENANSSRRTK